MSLEVNIHPAQISILRELLFTPDAGYSELQKPTGLTGDHFNFHIMRLVELSLVERVERGRYRLTTRGKEYANKLDTDRNTIERQPKIAVLLAITKKIDGKLHYLFQERTKHPYFGYYGFPTGKIRWGESIVEAAARELMEETGLEAEFEYKGLYHERTLQTETGELLEDKVFLVVSCTGISGQLVEQFEGGRNVWLTVDDKSKLPKHYTSFDTELSIAKGEQTFVEEIHSYAKTQF
jgi:8-oxo-dGTP diphosphatase